MKTGRSIPRGSVVAVGIVLAVGSAVDASPWGKVVRGLAALDVQASAGRENWLGQGYDIVFDFPGPLYRITTNLGLEGLGLGDLGLANVGRWNVGLADVTLQGSVETGVSFTRRILPSVEFASKSLNGPLKYSIRTHGGLENGPITGQILVDNSGSINLFGAYSLHVSMSGRGLDPNTGETLDFDLGPIDISGNIFLDFLNGTNPLNRMKDATAAQAKSRNVASLRSKAAAGEMLSDDEMMSLIEATLPSAFLNDSAIEAIAKSLRDGAQEGEKDRGGLRALAIPEPGTLLLLGAPLLLLCRRRA